MLTTAVKKITLNNLGNLDIKDESDLYDNTGNKIGIVKIELPNCNVDAIREVDFYGPLYNQTR